MSKRSFVECMAGTEPTLTITTADGGRLEAHSEVLRLVCSCLRNSPATDTWDLQHVQTEGKPVAADTVAAVVECIYHFMGAMDIEMDQSPNRFSLMQLQDMLLFADAIGCSKRVLSNIASLIDVCVVKQLELDTPMYCKEGISNTPSKLTVVLHLERVYTLEVEKNQLYRWHTAAKAPDVVEFRPETDDLGAFTRAVAKQLESLLYTGFKLDVESFLLPIIGFLQMNSTYESSLIVAASQEIMSARVVSAAGTSSMGRIFFISSLFRIPLRDGIGVDTMFGDILADDLDMLSSINFRATLLRDLCDFRKGDKVIVRMDLRKGNFQVALASFPNTFDHMSCDLSLCTHRLALDCLLTKPA